IYYSTLISASTTHYSGAPPPPYPFPTRPPSDLLKTVPDSATNVSLDVLDSRDPLVRRFTPKPRAPSPDCLKVRAGMNRFVWNLRSEEHTSGSISYAVFCLKKKKRKKQ